MTDARAIGGVSYDVAKFGILLLVDIQTIIQASVPILKKYGVKKAALFGSVVRGEASETSDIDMLVETPRNVSLFGFIDIKLALEDALGKKVDLIEYESIKPRLRPYILHDEKVFFPQPS